MALLHSPRIVTDGLVLCLDAANRKSYPGSGTVWRDLAGSNNGTLTNGPTFNSANGGSIVFDGSNDYVTVPGSYHLFSEFTISLWFKPKNTITSGANQIGRLWGKGGDLECRFDGTVNNAQISGRVACDLGASGSLLSTNNIWSNTVWYNLVTVLLVNSSALYVQSRLDSTGARGSVTNQTANLQIGRSASNGGSPFPGNISNFQIYNRALTPAEIQQNYNALKGRYNL